MTTERNNCAIVTGASRGIGREIALRLARDGFAVAVNYASDDAGASETVKNIEAAGGRALAIRADVSQPDDVQRLFVEAGDKLGRIAVVVSNAGIMPLAPISQDSLAAFDKTIGTNLRGTFLVMAQAAGQLGEGGRIIVLSSSVLAKSFPGYGPYIASKAGIEGLVHVLANELRGRGVCVNAVAPGPVATDLFLAGKSQEQIDQIVKLSPLERVGQPEEIAAAVSFLAGPDGRWVNSQVLRVNGGFA